MLRIGRLSTQEVVLNDPSVSRRHAEIRVADNGQWFVEDLGSTNGTLINGVRITPGEHPINAKDIVQFGKLAAIVEVEEITKSPILKPDDMVVTATAESSYEEGLKRIAFDRHSLPRAGEQLLALLRAGHHLVNLESETQLLDSILNDAVAVLDAQRGAIVLADSYSTEPSFDLRALALGRNDLKTRFHYSKKLTQQVYEQGRSVLVTTPEEQEWSSQSIIDGSMSSVLCVLLRTPRRKLGVLHLDRGFFQDPFTEDDLLLADALAANVSAGIECSLLLRQQRDFFLKTIMTLADLIELRDEYTGGHTQRVTRYALMIAERLDLDPETIELIRLGTPLHDIGKLGIPDDILRATRRLTPHEFAIMQSHTTLGAAQLAKIAELEPIIPIVRSHHERWDGTGYPDRLYKEEIPLMARIVAVADAFDAMTSLRPYHPDRRGKPPGIAFAEVERQMGRQFDPICANAFLGLRDKILEVMEEQKSQLSGSGVIDNTSTNPSVAVTPGPLVRHLYADSTDHTGE